MLRDPRDPKLLVNPETHPLRDRLRSAPSLLASLAMTQPLAPLASPAELRNQIASLNHLLGTVQRTRSSLPSLLRSFNASASSSHADRAAIYRTASSEASTSIRALADELEKVEGTLQAAEESERRDGQGIRVRVLEQGQARSEGGWEKLGEILGVAAGAGGVGEQGKGKARAHESSLGDVSSPAELQTMLEQWEMQCGGKIKLQAVGSTEKECAEVRLQLKGVMRACILLDWDKREDGRAGRRCMVERVACFGLKEEVSRCSCLLGRAARRRADPSSSW